MTKYKTTEDSVLLTLMHQGDEDATSELVRRYRRNSKFVIHEILEEYAEFHFLQYVEVQDLMSMSLQIFFEIAGKKKVAVYGFYQYWYKIVKRRIIKHLFADIYPLITHTSKVAFDESYFPKDEINLLSSERKYTPINTDQEFEAIFTNPKNCFKKSDMELFFLLRDGYSCLEIAKMKGATYKKTKERANLILRKLNHILFK